jgi:uncharacterized protein involved in cysteine biosynthesis
MPNEQKCKRNSLIINPTLQKRIIKDTVKVPILTLVACIMLMAAFLWAMLPDVRALDDTIPGMYYILCGFLFSMLGIMFFSALYITVYTATRISNRIAGPLYRMSEVIKQVHEGNLDRRVTLREGDYLTEIAEDFNRLLNHLEKERPGASGSEKDATQEQVDAEPVCAATEERD